ncbi:hypothetical protein VE04_01424 [Pseudogymnoascus sp. 24MN13]|nr:hypothetical protein VE04_01424 [Pseudogymnoascus sp. 24MN13]
MQFGDHLSQFVATKQQSDLSYWTNFVETFFSPIGVLRHSVWIVDEQTTKQYEITFPALARYFCTHFESGVKNMQLIMEKGTEKELPNHCNYISSEKSSFIYWFENGSQLVANGKLKAQFDANQMIELLEFETNNHEEYLPRTKVVDAARPLHEWQKDWQKINAPADGKQSPEINKKGKARPLKSPPSQPPDIDIPDSKVKLNMGITPSVFRFLELAEVMGQMNPLFSYSHQHSSLAPYSALDQYVAHVSQAASLNPSTLPPGSRTPSLNAFTLSSPAAAQISLPDGTNPMQNMNMGSGNMQPTAMALQQSQQGSSSGVSANTSPNTSNKRRRPSEEMSHINGAAAGKQGGAGQAGGQSQGQVANTGSKVKPSPRIGGKRQKGGPA